MKKALKPEAKRAIVEEIVSESEVSIIRACRLLDVHRSKYYYKKKKDDREVIDAIREKAEHSKDGFWKIYCRLPNREAVAISSQENRRRTVL